MTGIGLTAVGGVRSGDFSLSLATSGFVEAGLCFPCRAGEVTSFSGRVVGEGGSIEFLSEGFVLPELSPLAPWTIQLPFTFSAMAMDLSASADGPRLLSGSGIVTGQFNTQSLDPLFAGTFYTFRSASYEFGELQAAPTPEPASLLLLGTGMAGLWVRRRSRSRS